jgi:hypothetical protein
MRKVVPEHELLRLLETRDLVPPQSGSDNLPVLQIRPDYAQAFKPLAVHNCLEHPQCSNASLRGTYTLACSRLQIPFRWL